MDVHFGGVLPAATKSVWFSCSSVLFYRSPSDKFITVVYNDETHTFDYVIKVLQRAVSCPPSQASDYATIIDREVSAVGLVKNLLETTSFVVWFLLAKRFNNKFFCLKSSSVESFVQIVKKHSSYESSFFEKRFGFWLSTLLKLGDYSKACHTFLY